jgi:hypothetical protein
VNVVGDSPLERQHRWSCTLEVASDRFDIGVGHQPCGPLDPENRNPNQCDDEGRNEKSDEVALAILAGAKREVQLFELSTWGEDVGLASRATFSRVKIALEDRGVIETEKIPIDVGRPRQRLVLANTLRGYEASDLPAAVRDELQPAPA